MRTAIALVCALMVWVSAYIIGVFPWFGAAWLKRSSFGAGPITIAGESRAGTSIGFDDFYLFEGQEVVIDYDVDIRTGSLWFHVFRPFSADLGDGVTHDVTSSGKGTWTTPVGETGYYHISVQPSVLHGPGEGWDMTYSAQWGARGLLRARK